MYGLSAPASGGFGVSSSNTTSLRVAVRGLYVGTPGSVRVSFDDGSEATFADVPAGTFMPIRVRKVFESGTTAGSIVGLL